MTFMFDMGNAALDRLSKMDPQKSDPLKPYSTDLHF